MAAHINSVAKNVYCSEKCLLSCKLLGKYYHKYSLQCYLAMLREKNLNGNWCREDHLGQSGDRED